MNPTVSVSKVKDLECLFENYKSKEKDNVEDVIKGVGFIELLNDLGSSGSLDPLVFILAWKFQSRTQWELSKIEWMSIWALAGASNLADMKTMINKWRSELKDPNIYRNFYSFVFDYLKTERATVMDKVEAITAWKIVGIDQKWSLFGKWEEWWTKNPTKVISKDVWLMLLRFIEQVGINSENYDPDGCWPTSIDDFVCEVLKKEDR